VSVEEGRQCTYLDGNGNGGLLCLVRNFIELCLGHYISREVDELWVVPPIANRRMNTPNKIRPIGRSISAPLPRRTDGFGGPIKHGHVSVHNVLARKDKKPVPGHGIVRKATSTTLSSGAPPTKTPLSHTTTFPPLLDPFLLPDILDVTSCLLPQSDTIIDAQQRIAMNTMPRPDIQYRSEELAIKAKGFIELAF
jgi:hypothetical protein